MEKLVLIVDDDQTFRELLRALLEIANFCVIDAKSGYAALKLATYLRPNLIISDVDMPEMNGFETLKALRQNPETEDIPIILLSGNSEQHHQRLAFEAGASAYLVKPVDSEVLLTAIAKQLRLESVELT
jgi:CheY-like chemotaxis protein